MINYDQNIRDTLSELLEKLDPKVMTKIEYEIEQLRYYTEIRTQMIDGLAEELQRLKSNYSSLISEVSDDDDYFESESRRERGKR